MDFELDFDWILSIWILVLITSNGFVSVIDKIEALTLEIKLQISICFRYYLLQVRLNIMIKILALQTNREIRTLSIDKSYNKFQRQVHLVKL